MVSFLVLAFLLSIGFLVIAWIFSKLPKGVQDLLADFLKSVFK